MQVSVNQARPTSDEMLRNAVLNEHQDQMYRGIDGNMHGASYFLDHANPGPGIRSKQEGFVANSDRMAQLHLDRMTGDSRIRIERSEQTSLFEPSFTAQQPYGAPPNTLTELEKRTRENVSTRRDGVNPFAQSQEAPGTGRNGVASSRGFNASHDFRDMNYGHVSIDETRVRAKPSFMNKEGLNGVAESQVKTYGELGHMEYKGKPREHEIGPERWNFTTGAVKRERGDREFAIAGYEVKRSDASAEYMGVASGTESYYTDLPDADAYHEPSKRQATKNVPFGAASFIDQSGSTDIHRQASSTRPSNNRAFNNKYLDGNENTYFGIASDMLKSVAQDFFVRTDQHPKQKRGVGNSRQLYNPDTTHRLGGVVYDDKADNGPTLREMAHVAYMGNPNRGQANDSYLTQTFTEAVQPRESTYFDENGSRLSNARSMTVTDQPYAHTLYQVPDGAILKEQVTAYDLQANRGVSGNMSSGAGNRTMDFKQFIGEKNDKPVKTQTTSYYMASPNMTWANTEAFGSRESLAGKSTKNAFHNVSKTTSHPSEHLEHFEQYAQSNPYLISNSQYKQAL